MQERRNLHVDVAQVVHKNYFPALLAVVAVFSTSTGCQYLLGEEDRVLGIDAVPVPDAAPDGRVSCPTDMVQTAPSVCVDRYEASHDADNADFARSVEGAVPWADVTWAEADAACELAGKRLCSRADTEAACDGPSDQAFCYGNVWDGQVSKIV